MSDRVTFGRLSARGGGGRGDGPFRILLMGDFSARAARGLTEPVGTRRIRPIDVDNWEQSLAELGGSVSIPVAGPAGAASPIQPEQIDDFHPDQLFDRLEVFQALRSLRKRLTDPGSFAAAAEEVRSWAAEGASADQAPAAPAEPGPAARGAESTGDLLGRLLGRRPAGAIARSPAGGAAGSIDALLRGVVGPHIVPATDRQQAELVARVDQAVAAQMRSILHHADFRALEAAWRSVHFLVTHLETGEDLKLGLLDVTKAELAADLLADEDLETTGLFKRLVARTVGSPGGEPWALLAGAFYFDRTPADAELLGRVARIARAAGAPLVGGAVDRLVGCASLAATPDPDDWPPPDAADPAAAAAWQQLRRLPEASWLALGLPRMLLRLPYGKDTEPVSRFEFEEFTPDSGHEDYLWANPAFALAQVLGAGFTDNGWDLAAELFRDIEDVPMHVYQAGGQRQVTPCAEVYLTDRAGQTIQDMGLTALLSVQGRNVIRVRGIPALAEPVAALSGRWG